MASDAMLHNVALINNCFMTCEKYINQDVEDNLYF